VSHAPRQDGQVVDAAPETRAPVAVTLVSALSRAAQSRIALSLAALSLAALALLASCGSPARAPLGTAAASSTAPQESTTAAATVTESPTPPAAATRAPAAGPPAPAPAASAPAGAVKLPWPAASATEAAALQKSVDAGSEPWLLDPTEVAMSYASAAHGWTQATAQARPGGTTIEVQQSGRTVVLSLTQPVRTGAGGIWVVTGENPGR
jgi:hypothetical protein